MGKIIRFRWVVLLVWIGVAVGLFLNAPSMETLVREKGQIDVPEGYPSSLANQIIADHDKDGSANSIVTVFHDDKKLSNDQINEIKDTVDRLTNEQKQLGISNITSHFKDDELKDQLVSTDGKNILVLIDFQYEGRTIQEVREALEQVIKTDNVAAYMTGDNLIVEDVTISSEQGLKRTEIITVVFILFVLILVFRSAVAPLIPLLTVGITYLTSQSVVAFLVDRLNFPLSNFTQIFLVAVLFGIGTDYCILLLSRYKEELAKDNAIVPAIIETYRTAGKTVIYSGLAALVGFASIGFATFKLYQSAAAVAVGVAILLLALFTIVPFFMATLGKKLFWPQKGAISHSESKSWGMAADLSLSRPIVTLAIVAVVTVPLLIKYDGTLSFNSLDEIGDRYDSVKAFNYISESFGPGDTLPTQVVIEHDESMKTTEYLTLIEKISREIAAVDQVNKVRSATRPVGDDIDELYVGNQVKELHDGLSEGKDGLSTIEAGLSEAVSEIGASGPDMEAAVSGVDELVDGTLQLKDGVTDLKTGLQQIEQGVKDGSLGAKELKNGLQLAKENGEQLVTGSEQLLVGMNEAADGISELAGHYQEIAKGLVGVQAALSNLEHPLKELAATKPELMADANFQTIYGTIVGIEGVSPGLNQQFPSLVQSFNKLNQGLAKFGVEFQNSGKNINQLVEGQRALIAGLDQVVAGLDELESGLNAAAIGQGTVISQLPQMETGLGELANGQGQLQSGFGNLIGQLGELEDGLSQSADGIGQVGNGLKSANDYLAELANTSDAKMTGFHIPKEVIENEEFAQVFDVYMSEDGKMTTFDVVLDVNPYSNEALQKITDIRHAVQKATKNTDLESGRMGITGVSSMYNDLQNISDADFSRTIIFMLSGIGLILIILLRSLVMPIYLIASLLITYFSSVAVTELVFVNLLGYPGINWAVPFFGFVILMALGVDYSIFLMDRFNEYKEMPVEKALILSMRNMGTVIISAVIILSGTFAAMLPSGVLSLLQIATLVLTGLLLYAFVMLPLFVPVMVKLFGKANWWPFFVKRHE